MDDKFIESDDSDMNIEKDSDTTNVLGENGAESVDVPDSLDVNSEALEYTAEVTEKKTHTKMKNAFIHIFSFLIPFAIMIFAFSQVNIFPFGDADRQIMVIDSWHQYFPFLNELQTKLLSGDSILYSFGIGGGVNFLTLLAYYGSTPIYLLSVFFPKEYLREFMMLATLIKIACCGLFFSIYLRGIFKKADISTVAFSVLYALSAYAIGYYWCLMWLDCMALLPLVILGLHNLIENKKFLLYSISIALCLICNYYIAFFVALFVFFYYFIIYFSRRKTSASDFIFTTLRVGIFSLLGVGLSAILLYPTWLALSNTGNAGSSFPKTMVTYNSLFDILTNLLVYTKPAIRAGLPNIACGLVSVIFAIYYFINPKFSIKERLLNGGMLLFIAVSFNINILNFLWHGMHFPNEIPYRFAFVFSFVLLTIAYKAYLNFDSTSRKKTLTVLLAVLGFIILAERIYFDDETFHFRVFYISLAFLVVYFIILFAYKKRKFAHKYFSLLIFFVAVFEATLAGFNGAQTTTASARNGYPPQKEEVQRLINKVAQTEEEPFYRLEISRWYSTNDPALYGYRGISQFSSMANSRFTALLEDLGLAASPGSNRYLYSSATPLFNAMFSIKYMITRDEHMSLFNSVAFEEVGALDPVPEDEEENAKIYENKYWLPIAYTVDPGLLEWENSQHNTFIIQNHLLKNAVNMTGDVFKSIYPSLTSYDNLVEARSDYGNFSIKYDDPSQKGKIVHVYTSDKNQQMYLFIDCSRAKNASVTTPYGTSDYEINRGITVDCGYIHAGQEVKVVIETDAASSGNFKIYAVGFNEELFAEYYDILAADKFNTTFFSDTKIQGNIYVAEDSVLMTSIPYEEGWKVKIDGEEAEIKPFMNGLIAADLSEGYHEVEFTYFTYGLKEGIIVSIISLLLIVVICVFRRLKKFYLSEENEYELQ